MLCYVADGMDSRDAPLDERYIVASFIRGQFAGDPDALYISNTRIAKDQPGIRRHAVCVTAEAEMAGAKAAEG
jgi:hypothetical protein